jgi:hypothetical protein
MDLSDHTIEGLNSELAEGIQVTEASLTTEDGEPLLFELDGEPTEEA